MRNFAMQPLGILETALYVSNIERAEAFYATVLGLRRISKQPERHVFYYCGESVLLLFRAEATAIKTSSVPTHGAHGPGHMAFRVREEEMEAWRQHLQSCGVEIETEIRWPEGGYSIYFRDPDGNSLELATANVWPAE